MRTVGRYLTVAFFAAMMLLGLAGAAQAQTPSPSPSPSPSSTTTTTARATTTTTATTAKTATTTAVGGSSLPKTGGNLGLPLAIGGGTLIVLLTIRRLAAAR